MKRSPALPVLTAIAALCTASAAVAQSGVPHDVNIESGKLADSLRRLADQVNLQVVFYVEDTSEVQANALRGRYTPEQALTRLLQGSDLEFEYVDATTISVRRKQILSSADASSVVDGNDATGQRLRISQTSQPAPSQGAQNTEAGPDQVSPSSTDGTDEDLKEIIVTGTCKACRRTSQASARADASQSRADPTLAPATTIAYPA